MFAGKQFDMVMGVDIHIIQPSGPVPPVPIPHPFIGIVFDPMEFVPIIGASILVNGLPRAQAGTTVKAVPSHIPIGGIFVKPPSNDGEIYMGSQIVNGDSEPIPSLGTPVLTCQDAGMVSIPRPNRKSSSKAKSLVLPTSILLPVPKGGPVLVAGAFIVKQAIKVAVKQYLKKKALKKLLKEAKKHYKGKLIKNNKPDLDADKLAKKLDGESRVSFAKDSLKREFDVISKEFIGQAKTSGKLGKAFREQAKATFEAAKVTGRKVYYEFQNKPSEAVVKKLKEYSNRYDTEVVIDVVKK